MTMQLTLENLIDMREAVSRRINELNEFSPRSLEAKKEHARRWESLADSLHQIETQIKKLNGTDQAHPAIN